MKTYKLKDIISQGTKDLFYIWWQELKAVVKDQGVLIFFILVPLGYPLLYTFIYTNETVREVPAAVVDNNRSSLSREYLRLVDAGADLEIVSHCSDMEEARTAKCMASSIFLKASAATLLKEFKPMSPSTVT